MTPKGKAPSPRNRPWSNTNQRWPQQPCHRQRLTHLEFWKKKKPRENTSPLQGPNAPQAHLALWLFESSRVRFIKPSRLRLFSPPLLETSCASSARPRHAVPGTGPQVHMSGSDRTWQGSESFRASSARRSLTPQESPRSLPPEGFNGILDLKSVPPGFLTQVSVRGTTPQKETTFSRLLRFGT